MVAKYKGLAYDGGSQQSHKMETQMEMAQSRLCVWDRIATEWAGGEERSIKRTGCQNAVDKRDFVTFAMMSVKHSVAHRPNISNRTKKIESREH